MPNLVFTTITFSPVTEFIEKTRKLRDLYGSSFILSYLAEAVCRAAQEQLGPEAVVSPALLNTTMGTPDQIVIQGDFPEAAVQEAFGSAWGKILDACREWVCDNCHDWIETARQKWVADGEWSSGRTLPWDRDWQHWKNYAWEVFWAQGDSIPEALEALAYQESQQRNWVGVNWVGESSTLSGVDAIAWPGLGRRISQKRPRQGETDRQIRTFFYELNLKIGEAILEDDLINYRHDPSDRLRTLALRYDLDPAQSDLKHPEHQTLRQALAQKLGEAIITNREHLSILELTKRLFTLETVAKTLPHSEQLQKELPASFKEVNLWKTDQPMGWFRGDGDRAGEYVSEITRAENAGAEMKAFSTQMRKWGQSLKEDFEEERFGRIVFAGGDDFLGIFYPASKPTVAMDWLGKFKRDVWNKGQDGNSMPITSSVGFVWASPQVPQRDVLQHCDAVERIAKDGGRDRLALRVLFNGGNYLDWVCPWDLLDDGLLQGYCDRSGKTGLEANWTHFYNDVAVLEARHAFGGDQIDVAIALFGLYFPNFVDQVQHCDRWWNEDDSGRRVFSGILGDRKNYERGSNLDCAEVHSALNDWIINLAKVGFHLCSNT